MLNLRPMKHGYEEKHKRIIAIWLFVGVFMIMIQILIGGITRLTGSGLSITEWAPIMGTIPPLNADDWMVAFEKYQQSPQYIYQNSSITLSEFKYIYFWEWFHRIWARLLGVAFIIPFIYFLIKKWFTKSMIRPMIILFILGGLQGFVGWIMVASGLVGERTSVDHYNLAAHFIAALVLLCYTLWFALSLTFADKDKTFSPRLKNFTIVIMVVLAIQLLYGAFMAGLHAALAAPTWPGVNGVYFPGFHFTDESLSFDFTAVRINVQWIHRILAYLLTILLIAWWLRAKKTTAHKVISRFAWLPIAVVMFQILLGILTVLNTASTIPVVWAVLHQFNGMILLTVIFIGYFLLTRQKQLA